MYLEYLTAEPRSESKYTTGILRLPKPLITPRLLVVNPGVTTTPVELLYLESVFLLNISYNYNILSCGFPSNDADKFVPGYVMGVPDQFFKKFHF